MSNPAREEFERMVMSHKKFVLNIPQFIKLKLQTVYVSYMDYEPPSEIDISKGDLIAFQHHDYGNCIELGEVLQIYENEKEGITYLNVKLILHSSESVYNDGSIVEINPSYIWCYFEPIE